MTTLITPILGVLMILTAVFVEADPMAIHTDSNPPNRADIANVSNVRLIYPAAAPSARATYIPPTPSPTPSPTPTATPAPAGRVTAAASAPDDIRAIICSYPWPCEEALFVAGAESGMNPDVWNHQGSGACGLFQLLPCQCIDVECNVERAYAKWDDGDGIIGNGQGNFERHWYRFWAP